MITAKSQRRPDDGNYVHGCFTVRVGANFTTYQEILKYAHQNVDIGDSDYTTAMNAILNAAPSDNPSDTSYLPMYASRRKCRDTSLGGNDAINPLPQFSVDDDIVHPHHQVAYGDSVGMGRVYSENYDDLQQILYLGFGIPVFSNIGSFWKTAIDVDMANHVNKASKISPEKIGYLLGATPVKALKIATVPYKFLRAMTDTIQTVPITKYYTFSSQMPMYFRFVNTILVMLATNMNMMGSSFDSNTTGSETSNVTPDALVDRSVPGVGQLDGQPAFFRDAGVDMAKIMLRRYFYENGYKNNSYANYNTDDALFKSTDINGDQGVVEGVTNKPSESENSGDYEVVVDDQVIDTEKKWKMSWFDGFKAAYSNAIYDGHLFIGFRIDKGMGTTESFSNNTGESNAAQIMNSKFQEARSIAFDGMGGNYGESLVGKIASSVVGIAKSAVQGFTNTFSMDALGASITGAAKIDIPDVWMGSGWSRSASFTITCMSPYGDMESIFMSEYVPLACILAGALPRGTGNSSHSSPFVCQAYCRGQFSSPLCIIETLEVSRGNDQFGFNMARLPLELTMNVTLKDLSPTMYMNMGGSGSLTKAVFGSDDNFGEYMLTLSGMGLRERLSPFRSIRRKATILLSTVYKNKLSPFMLGMEGGSRFIVSRAISTITSGGRGLPGN